MAFDGILVHALVQELDQVLQNGRINKIQQPEQQELLITVKTDDGQKRLLLSANASLPLLYLTEENKQSPLTAPNFCMLLRKHIGSARIVSVTQPGLERIVDIELEHLNELGDLCRKHLITELMGKYSNIIFTDESFRILDAIRRVPPTVSSVRTVLPGENWFIPETQGKKDALTETRSGFLSDLHDNERLTEAVSAHYTGFSIPSVSEMLLSSGLDGSRFVSELSSSEKELFCDSFLSYTGKIAGCCFRPQIAYRKGNEPEQFSAMPLVSYQNAPETFTVIDHSSVSALLSEYYSRKNLQNNMRQRSQDLKKVVQNLLDRAVKKLDLQNKQMNDTKKMEQNRLYGELLNAWSYMLPVGEKTVTVQNYYDENRELVIPVDPDLSIADNAKKYFDRYGKQKRTAQALSQQIPETEDEISHLSSILTSIDLSTDNDALLQIREEMAESHYIRKIPSGKGKAVKSHSRPYHYLSSDGFHIYVGKNNLQNDELTHRFAKGNDLWFHAKKMPGSHVILVTEGREVPDRAYEEAGALAAYYSSGRDNEKVEIDYVPKKEVKKPAGGKPGFVVYYTNYSLIAVPDISGLTLLSR